LLSEINYPEHLHIKNEPQTKLKKKDFAYLESLHPSTAPNKTGKTRKLFQSKKAQELMKKKAKNTDMLTESLVEKSKGNIFKQDEPKEERKIMTKEEFEKEDRRRRTDKNQFQKKNTKNAFESIKRKKYKKKKPNLMINTDLEETGMRRAATTKNASGGKNIFLDNDPYQDEYFESEKKIDIDRVGAMQTQKQIKRNMSAQKILKARQQSPKKKVKFFYVII